MMKRSFSKPLVHYTHCAPAYQGKDLAQMSVEELTKCWRQSQEEEGARVFVTNKEAVVRQIGDQCVLVPVGKLASLFNGMMTLNRTSQFLWEQYQEPVSLQTVIDRTKEHFNGPENQLEMEVRNFTITYLYYHLLEENL